jgi:hypothetical protein
METIKISKFKISQNDKNQILIDIPMITKNLKKITLSSFYCKENNFYLSYYVGNIKSLEYKLKDIKNNHLNLLSSKKFIGIRENNEETYLAINGYLT